MMDEKLLNSSTENPNGKEYLLGKWSEDFIKSLERARTSYNNREYVDLPKLIDDNIMRLTVLKVRLQEIISD